MPSKKKCRLCKIEKSIGDFHKCRARRDGIQQVCKSCAADAARVWHSTHAAHKKILNQKWWAHNVERGLMLAARYRAKRDNIPFDLCVEDIHIPECCPILGVALEQSHGGSGGGPNSPSLDRIVPKLGYVRGNIQVISGLANRLKTDATPEELLKFAEWVMKTYAT